MMDLIKKGLKNLGFLVLAYLLTLGVLNLLGYLFAAGMVTIATAQTVLITLATVYAVLGMMSVGQGIFNLGAKVFSCIIKRG